MLCRARRADHVGASRLGDLHAEMPDSSGSGEDEHALAGLDFGRLDEGLPRRQPRERERRGLDVAQSSGVRASWRDGEVTYSA